MTDADSLIDPTLLFQFSLPLRSTKTDPKSPKWTLDEAYDLPHLANLAGNPTLAKLRAAWSTDAIFIQVDVRGRRTPVESRNSLDPNENELRVWIDTHSSPDIHRGTKYCHCFSFSPGTQGKTKRSASGRLDPIPRAKENPNPVAPRDLIVRCEWMADGYRLIAAILAEQLTGFSPNEFPEMGFFYQLIDDELGIQTLSLGPTFRFAEDPSLWSRLRLDS